MTSNLSRAHSGPYYFKVYGLAASLYPNQMSGFVTAFCGHTRKLKFFSETPPFLHFVPVRAINAFCSLWNLILNKESSGKSNDDGFASKEPWRHFPHHGNPGSPIPRHC